MADVSTLKINDNSYNIKDATARRNIITLTSTVDAKLDTSHVVDNLTTTASGYALDARAGKALNDAKLNASNVINNLTTTASGYALDARAGKALNDAKLNASNVVNNLTTTASGYALDARQGRALNSAISAMGQEVTARIKNVGNFGTQYTNVNLLPTNTIGWINNNVGNISNLPSQSAYHMITVFPLSTHGFQLAIRYNADGMYLRTYAEGTWSAWKNLV